ncbi:D-inositol 3-phosphate glycosyltransferase [Polystyrenella longa]|uniref:D-inositol 3-phosphate glycosyltransferase n=1 Tax=Polystyrenella longa TaxID=2528007 RepID=A0A518CQB5_9PLAN|nr:glycosyltransferase [Polystyrenella longa]QDU81411.1 D-inositol 3-phosphate glycosyltransferase [Polystyrenella longa]
MSTSPHVPSQVPPGVTESDDKSQPSQSNSGQPNSDKMRRLKVAHIVEATNAGVGQHVLDMVGGLLDRDVDVHLIYSPLRMSGSFESKMREFEESGATLFSCPISAKIRPSDSTAALCVRRYLKKQGPFDIVHGHSSKGGAIARLAAFGLKTPVFFTPNAISTINPMISKRGKKFYGTIERILWSMTSRLVACSPEEAEHCIELGIPESGVVMIPNGINGIDLPSREEVRTKYDLPMDKIVLGFVGRFSPQKGPEIILKAFALIAKKYPDVILAMIGGGDQEAELKQLVADSKIGDQVRFLGMQPGAWSMPGFDVFCMTSRYEGYPYVVMEAAHASLPIVMTRFQCDTLMVEQGVQGYVVETDDFQAMADSIEKLLQKPENIKKFGEAAHEKYKIYSAEAMVDQCLTAYHDALK